MKKFVADTGPPIVVAIVVAILVVGAPALAANETHAPLALLPQIANVGEFNTPSMKVIDMSPVVGNDNMNVVFETNTAGQNVGNQASEANVKATAMLAHSTEITARIWPQKHVVGTKVANR